MKIAIDGPAGAGKSTIAAKIAKDLGYHYLDTGAMYRAAAYYMMKNGIEIADEQAVNGALPLMDMEIYYDASGQHVLINNDDITSFIRTDEISRGASVIGTNPQVRNKLVDIQRKIADKYDIVMDGRDIGTYVLPDAEFKFYLTADVTERAKRRFLENNEHNNQSLKEIEEEIKKRDYNDMNRKFAPLCKADDAVLIDTTSLTVDEVAKKISDIVNGV